jgi:hypothetical protein
LCGAEAQTFWKVNQKYFVSFEVWCWRRMEKISWADRARNEEVLQRVKEESNILQTAQRMKANCIDYSLHRNCLLNKLSK